MIRSAGDQAAALIRAACERAAAAGALPAGGEGIPVEFPGDSAHGDCASSFAMAGAGALHMAPLAVARAVAEHLELEGSYFNRAEIAGPGFLNFFFGPRWYGEVLAAAEAEGAGKWAPARPFPAAPADIEGAREAVVRDILAGLPARPGSRRPAAVPVGRVNLLRAGRPARLSGRTGGAVTDLLDEVGADAVRFYFSSRSPSAPLDFDLDLAVRQDGGNPLYRIQYAHARICSLLSRLAEEEADVPAADAARLTAPEEKALVKSLARYPEALRLVARDLDPSPVNRCLTALAGDFRRFCSACPLRGEDGAVLSARLRLAGAVRSVLAGGLSLLGVTAPERM